MKLVRALITAAALSAGVITQADLSAPTQARTVACIHCWDYGPV